MGLLDLTSKALGLVIEQVKAGLHDYNMNQLVHQAYSKDPAIRTLARSRLKLKNPDVFEMLEKVE